MHGQLVCIFSFIESWHGCYVTAFSNCAHRVYGELQNSWQTYRQEHRQQSCIIRSTGSIHQCIIFSIIKSIRDNELLLWILYSTYQCFLCQKKWQRTNIHWFVSYQNHRRVKQLSSWLGRFQRQMNTFKQNESFRIRDERVKMHILMWGVLDFWEQYKQHLEFNSIHARNTLYCSPL